MSKDMAEAAGQLLVVGFKGCQTPPPALAQALKDSEVSGVILFKRNIGEGDEGLRQVAELNATIDALRPADGPPPFIAVDQEGGRVRRLRHGVTPIPAMAAVGALDDPDLAARVSEVLATELAALGFNLNFAPVLDVFTNPENTVIGDRAFGGDPELVARMAGAFTVGHYIAGVVPCGKHFPGHGDTLADSHYELPVLLHDLPRLQQVELVPFARAVAASIPMIMTAHILIPALDTLHPVTLSRHGVGRLLRQEMGYEGVIITDDLEMNAIAERYSVEETIELGLEAGVDIFLICHTEEKWRRAHAHLVHLAQTKPEMRERILTSARRVRELKRKYLPRHRYEAPSDLLAQLGTAEHRQILSPISG